MTDPLDLIIERPNEPLERTPWELGAAIRFHLGTDEISIMRDGRTVWRGDTAFSLEEMSMTKPNRVEIWRYNDRTLTVAHSNGNTWNELDTFTRRRHVGIWDSLEMDFVPVEFVPSDRFTDGTPVVLYEGLEPERDDLTSMLIDDFAKYPQLSEQMFNELFSVLGESWDV